MKTPTQRVLIAVVLAGVPGWATIASAQSESAGVNQYFGNCASCHESSDPARQAPPTSVGTRDA